MHRVGRRLLVVMQRAARYDVAAMRQDLAAKGMQPIDLARRCRPPVAASTVTRFFAGTHQTARMAKRLSRALGNPPDYYLVRSHGLAAADQLVDEGGPGRLPPDGGAVADAPGEQPAPVGAVEGIDQTGEPGAAGAGRQDVIEERKTERRRIQRRRGASAHAGDSARGLAASSSENGGENAAAVVR